MSDLEKRLAEAFADALGIDHRYWQRSAVAKCARIAAEEIEKSDRLHCAAYTQRAVRKARMDAAKRMRDFIAGPKPGDGAVDHGRALSDAAIARIIGADGHEGGEEVSGGAGNPNYRPGIEDLSSRPAGDCPNDPAQKAEPSRPVEVLCRMPPTQEPPRPDHLSPTHWTAILNETYAEGRAAAFEECAKIAELYAENWRQGSFHTLHSAVSNVAAAIRAAARKGEGE